MSRKRVIIAAPQSTQRRHLASQVEGLDDFVVVARTADLMQTYAEVEDKLPNVVLISDSLAVQAEFEVMRALFAEMDVRWLVLDGGKARQRMARRDGADLFWLPDKPDHFQLAARMRSITRKASAPHAINGADAKIGQVEKGFDRVILIGASTGGVDALLQVLSNFDARCPPTVIVQHTGSGFGASLASLLNRQCHAEVKLADSNVRLTRGTVLVGAGLRAHIELSPRSPLSAEPRDGPPVSGHLPSVDALFRSAVPLGTRAVAALLTGMGRDGAEGMQALRRAGARTFAQDEATSVVYGMPRAACELGGVEKSLSLAEIGPALLAAAQERTSR